MSDLYNAVFKGNFEETSNYLRKYFSDSKWECPTGEEDLEGIIDVLYAGCFQPELESEIIIEVDSSGNIRALGDTNIFASIIEG